jgi:hypothetical protein
MSGIFPPRSVFLWEQRISSGKTLKTFFPTHPVEEKEGSEQDF